MALIRTFTFTGSLESWVGTDNSDGNAINSSTDIGLNIDIGKRNDGAPYWEWTGTWEDLGANPGDTITSVQ